MWLKEYLHKISRKGWVLLAAGLGVAALLLLAAGISSLDLANPNTYALPTEQVEPPTAPPLIPGLSDFLAKLGLVFMLLVPLSIIYLIISKEARKRFLIAMIPLFLMVLALWYLLQSLGQNASRLVITPMPIGVPTPGVGSQAGAIPLQPFAPSAPPPWLIYVISLVIVALVALVVFLIVRSSLSRPRYQPAQKLAETAQDALDDLRRGGDLRDVILRCYKEMSLVAFEKRAIIRPEHQTPRIFARKLEDAGLPAIQVEQLTRLFEAVRYGGWQPGPGDEKDAIRCLETVVATLRGGA